MGNQLTRRSPRRGPVAVRKDGAKESAPKAAVHTSSIVVSANRRSFIRSISMPIAIPAGPRNVVGPPTPGRVSGSGHVTAGFDRALKHIDEAARHCTYAKTSPGESIGLPRSSTGSERVAGFEYRSLWWRVRGVQRPGVFEESLVPPAPDPGGTYSHLSLGSLRAPSELAHMYRYRWIDRSGSLALDRCLLGKAASTGGGEPSGSQLAHIRQYGRSATSPTRLSEAAIPAGRSRDYERARTSRTKRG